MNDSDPTLRILQAQEISQKIQNKPLKDRCFMVSIQWWRALTRYLGWSTNSSAHFDCSHPGIIDNTSLVYLSKNLKEQYSSYDFGDVQRPWLQFNSWSREIFLSEGAEVLSDFVYVNEETWNILVKWFGAIIEIPIYFIARTDLTPLTQEESKGLRDEGAASRVAMGYAPDRKPEVFRVYADGIQRCFLMSRQLKASKFFHDLCTSLGLHFHNVTIRHAPTAEALYEIDQRELQDIATPLTLNSTVINENTVEDLNIASVLLIARKEMHLDNLSVRKKSVDRNLSRFSSKMRKCDIEMADQEHNIFDSEIPEDYRDDPDFYRAIQCSLQDFQNNKPGTNSQVATKTPSTEKSQESFFGSEPVPAIPTPKMQESETLEVYRNTMWARMQQARQCANAALQSKEKLKPSGRSYHEVRSFLLHHSESEILPGDFKFSPMRSKRSGCLLSLKSKSKPQISQFQLQAQEEEEKEKDKTTFAI